MDKNEQPINFREHFREFNPDAIPSDSKAARIANLYWIRLEVETMSVKISEACIKFTHNVLARQDSTATFVKWSFNDRGTLIQIRYNVFDSMNNPGIRYEYVSFEELATFMEN